MPKTIIESQLSNTLAIVDGQTGELLQEQTTTQTASKTIRTAEPPYIKLYIEDMLYMSDMPKTFTNLTYSLVKRANYANDEEGLCVALTGFVKEKICKECGWEETRSLNNALSKLVKGNILKRLGTGTYQLNPYLFGKGEWKDIENIRVTWNYDVMKGRTFSTAFTYTDNSQTVSENIQAPTQTIEVIETPEIIEKPIEKPKKTRKRKGEKTA